MAKGFPYFKFKPTEWLTGDIVFESFAVQGLFINICALYWQRDGDVTLGDLKKRYKDPNELNELINRFIMVDGENISIEFLDEQLHEAGIISAENSRKGKLSAAAKALKTNRKSTAVKQQPTTANRVQPIKTNTNNNKKEIKIKSNNIPEVQKLRGDCKDSFLKIYKEKFQTEFYWGPKDATNLIRLIDKITFKVKEKFPGKESPEKVYEAFNLVLLQIKDQWVLSNFSIPVINSKFNEIFTQLKNGTGKSIAVDKNQAIRDLGNLASAIIQSPESSENK